MDPHPTAGNNLDTLLNVSPDEVNDAIQPPPQTKSEADGDLRERTKPKKASRIIGAMKHVAGWGAGVIRKGDRAAAHAGVKSARYRAGVVKTGKARGMKGPVEWEGRWDGKKGFVEVVTDKGGERAVVWKGEGGWRMGVGEVMVSFFCFEFLSWVVKTLTKTGNPKDWRARVEVQDCSGVGDRRCGDGWVGFAR